MSTAAAASNGEDASKLGFRKPEPPAQFQAVPTSTNIVGFFNNNRFPVRINTSALEISFELKPGEYLKIRSTGQKVNDPRLRAYVYSGGLSIEHAATGVQVPVVPLPRKGATQATQAPRPATPGFSGSREMPANLAKPQPKPALTAKQAQGQEPQPHVPGMATPIPENHQPVQKPVPTKDRIIRQGPVTGMSMENARNRGLIGRQRIVPEDLGVEASQADGSKSLPELKIPPMVRPNSAKVNPAAVAKQFADKTPEGAAQLQRATDIQNGSVPEELGDVADVMRPVSLEPQPIQESEQPPVDDGNDLCGGPDTGEQPQQQSQQTEAAQEGTGAPDNLPEPDLGEGEGGAQEQAQGGTTGQVDPKLKYFCDRSQKGFQYPSHYIRHIRKLIRTGVYTVEEVDQIEANLPKGNSTRIRG